MDSSTNHKLSPLKSPPLPSNSHHPTFPIIAVAIIGILATAFLLVSYYIFVIKCCLNWHRIDLLRRFSFSRRRGDAPSPSYSPAAAAAESRGLNDAAIRSIPIFVFKKSPDNTGRRRRRPNVSECAVCLNDFHDEEKLRVLPNCAHIFHIDCIDVWLQNNANCPLCRTTISPETKFPITPIRSRDPDTQFDENYVVIEIPTAQQSNSDSRSRDSLINSGGELITRTKKPGKIGSMGDEWIDIDRNKDEQFLVQPIRRSFSMDSAGDTQLCLAVQEIMQRRRRQGNSNNFEGSPSNEGSSSRGRKNSFFSFGGSIRSAVQVQPVLLEP